MGGADITGYNTTSAMLQYAVTEQKEEKEKKNWVYQPLALLYFCCEPPNWQEAQSPLAQGEIKD